MSVANLERLKREMVRQVVQENLDLIQGRIAAVHKPRSRSWRRPALGLGLAVLVASALSLTAGHSRLPQATRASPSLESGAEALGAEAVGTEPGGAEPAAEAPGLPEIIFPEIRGEESLDLARHWTEDEVAAAGATPVDPEVFPLEVRRVVIDPGHGGSALGTQKPRSLAEKELTLDIGLRLRPLLESAGFEVLMTRETDVDVSLQERALLANESQADIFVSIHVNWFDEAGDVRGVETYYLGTAKEAYLNRLAARENHDSGYALADMRRLLDRIYGGVRESKSRDLAAAVHGAMYRSLAAINPHMADRGVKTAPFLVLVDTEMPAILAEVSCLSNAREAELLGQEHYRQYIAESLARGISAYAEAARSRPAAPAASGATEERTAK